MRKYDTTFRQIEKRKENKVRGHLRLHKKVIYGCNIMLAFVDLCAEGAATVGKKQQEAMLRVKAKNQKSVMSHR